MDWSDLEKNISEFNSMLGLKKATTSSITGGRSPITTHERGVHDLSAVAHGSSKAGNMAIAGRHRGYGHLKERSKEEHKRVLSEMRSMKKPNLPK